MDFKSLLFVGIGAAPGAVLRMQILKRFYSYRKSYFWGLLFINSIATFFLSYFLAIQDKFILGIYKESFYLLFCVGFLGSFSTFSSLTFEIYNYYLGKRWKELYLIIFLSIALGLIASSMGYYLSND